MQEVATLVGAGLIPSISNQDYHAMEGVSKSGLDQFAKSPAHYISALQTPRAETQAMRIGSLFHSLILEPETIRIVPAPACDRRTKAGKAEYAEFCAVNEGAEVVSADEWEMLSGMACSIKDHPAANALLGGNGRAENSLFWKDVDTGVLCKCRPDFYRADGIVVDLKTTEDASPRAFMCSIAKYRYHVQSAFYSDGLTTALFPVKGFVFVAVEKKPPYAVAVYQLDNQAVEAGRVLYKDELLKMAVCMVDNNWPAYSTRIETLSLPDWAVREAIENG